MKCEFLKFLAGIALRYAVTWDVTPCNIVTSTDFARNVLPVCLKKRGAKIFCKQIRFVILTTH